MARPWISRDSNCSGDGLKKSKKRFWESSGGGNPNPSQPASTHAQQAGGVREAPVPAASGPAPERVPEGPSPEMIRVGELLRASAEGFGGALSSLKAPIEELRASMQDFARVTGPERLEVAAQAAVAPMRARMEEALNDLQRELDETRHGLKVLDTFVTQEQVGQLVREESRQAATRHETEFQVRLKELQQAFEDADDRYGQIKRLIDSFGPGGLPVLHQENTALRQRLARREKDLEEANARLEELTQRLASSERTRLALEFSQGVISREDLDKRRQELAEREAELRNREALEAEIQRLSRERGELSEELNRWLEMDRAEQKQRTDQKELARLRADAEEHAASFARLQAQYRRADTEWHREKARADALEARLVELRDVEQTAQQRARLLEAQQEEISGLRASYESARTEAAKARMELLKQQERAGQLQRALDEQKAREAGLEDAWRARQVEERKSLLEQLRSQFSEWAEQEAHLRAARTNTELTQARKELDELRSRFKTLSDEHLKLRERNRTLEAERQTEQTLFEKKVAQLAQEREFLLARVREDEARLIKQVQQERERVASLVAEDQAQLRSLQDGRRQLEAQVLELSGRKGIHEAELESLRRNIDDLRQKARSREERMRQLLEPVFPLDALAVVAQPPSELEWLTRVEKGLREAGFRFHSRLLHAFHTSLKVAQRSPLTLLAGISGTGKSELPRLYADLGGLSFLPVAVQPGWDSPSDLFGFFNYTDGRLKAEPLARLLWQVNAEKDPLHDGLSIVLLDEMNLARVEYYFSELLSKLEMRRGVGRQEDRARASVAIDIGAGEPPPMLYLDERVLFVGTMNEDESTHTLSDKVLDRACVLSFPSPRDMKLEKQVVVERAKERLAFSTWKQWCVEESPAGIASKLNEINDIMERLGRPFGHRLFRAIHSYIAQYPVRDERGREDAWSDQWVMKVLPRLKGLECEASRVRGGLDELSRHVPPDLSEAFDRARREDYFAWRGAADLYRISE
jgi:hypothetical protein